MGKQTRNQRNKMVGGKFVARGPVPRTNESGTGFLNRGEERKAWAAIRNKTVHDHTGRRRSVAE
jgi:hypothetical protein